MSLFDLLDDQPHLISVPNDTWRPEAPPSLDGVDEIKLNFETTGLQWWDGDLPISVSLYAKGRSWYLPWGHRGGGNLDEATMKRWFEREVRNKKITNINTRFEVHMAREWGIDLEAQGNTVSDIGHSMALLDDHRREMNLDSLVRDILRRIPMPRLDESKMPQFSAGAAQARSRFNVEVVHELEQILYPRLHAENLMKVQQLEDEVIYVVCEMEKNGTLINEELLDTWVKETLAKYHECLMELWRQTGLRINPNSGPDEAKLFRHLNIPMIELTESGMPSFTDDVIKNIDHPVIKLLRRAKKLKSLHSKFTKYQKGICRGGILRYALHQLRAAKDESMDAGESGTVVGRFTSTAIAQGVGINIQQVLKPEKQLLTYGDEYFIRELHIPRPGFLHASADAEQIQYRIFAHEAQNPAVLAAYRENPEMSFHRMTLAMIRELKPDQPYKKQKDLNFAKMFAAGPSKLGLMLGFITKKQFEELKAAKANRHHPWLATTKEILKIYEKVLPEVDILIKRSTELAESRGYVCSILGRRMRFPNGHRTHKALNGRIIMSEADIVKKKAVELHKERNYTNFLMRFQVHDEFDGDVPDIESAKRVHEVLNRQAFPLSVPILWNVDTGVSWGDCARRELEKIREELVEHH